VEKKNSQSVVKEHLLFVHNLFVFLVFLIFQIGTYQAQTISNANAILTLGFATTGMI